MDNNFYYVNKIENREESFLGGFDSEKSVLCILNHANHRLWSKYKKQKLANYEIKVFEYKVVLMDFNGQYINVDTICDIII